MKNKTISLFAMIAFTGFCVEFISCKKPTEGLKLAVNTEISSLVYTFQILDAQSMGELPVGETYSISISGDDKDLIYTPNGDRKFKFLNGFLTIMVKPGFKPSETRPIRFTLIIRNRNTLKTIIPVYLTHPEQGFRKIPVVRLDHLPDGVSYVSTSFKTNADGKTDTDIRIETPKDNGEVDQAEVFIPKNTEFFDPSGNKVIGDISVKVVHFDSRTNSSLSSFPGGFNVFDATGPQNQPIGNGSFQTAGFTAMEMSAGNQEVSSFSQDIKIKMTIDSELKDPDTKQNINTNNNIPVWSLNTENGKWQQISNSNISYDPGSQRFSAEFGTRNRSWYNLDYFFRGCPLGGQLTLDYNGPYMECKYYIEYEDSRFRYFNLYPKFTNLYQNKQIFLNELMENSGLIRLRFVHPETEAEIGVTPYFSPCGAYSFPLNYSSSNPLITAKVTGICPNNGRMIKPSGAIYYHESGQTRMQYLGYMSNGVYQTSTLAPGKSYVMYTRDGENRLVSTTIEVLQDWANQEIDFIWEMEIEEYSGCR